MLPDDLQAKWDEASRTGQPVIVGRFVVCDFCDVDFTDSPASGGCIFESKAVCPACYPTVLGELQFIRATCPSGQSFADFVREWRGPDSTIQIS